MTADSIKWANIRLRMAISLIGMGMRESFNKDRALSYLHVELAEINRLEPEE